MALMSHDDDLIVSGTTATGTINSDAFNMGRLRRGCFTLEFTGTSAVGTAVLQISNSSPDKAAPGASDASWQTVSGSSISVTAGGNHGWEYDGAAPWVRVQYVHSSGTDTINKCRATSKEG